MNKITDGLKKIWHFLWHEESIASYVVFFIVAYLVLKFVAFPVFLVATGLSDVTAVMSTSMVHWQHNFDETYREWFNDRNITVSANWIFQDGLEVGDVVFVKKFDPTDIGVGDVIVFKVPSGESIIHRVIEVSNTTYTTKGDANSNSKAFEMGIAHDRVVGKAVSRVPILGYPRVFIARIIGR